MTLETKKITMLKELYDQNKYQELIQEVDKLKKKDIDNVEIFNHTSDHESLLDQNKEEIIESILNAQEEIKKNLDILPSIFSYPYGENSIKTKFILKNIGFKLAFTQNSGPISIYSDPYFLPRFPINSEFGSMQRFKMLINTKPLGIFNFSPKYLPSDISYFFINKSALTGIEGTLVFSKCFINSFKEFSVFFDLINF